MNANGPAAEDQVTLIGEPCQTGGLRYLSHYPARACAPSRFRADTQTHSGGNAQCASATASARATVAATWLWMVPAISEAASPQSQREHITSGSLAEPAMHVTALS